MALTSLDIRDKAFSTKFRGYDIDEVEEFLDIIVNDYEELIRENHEKEAKIRNLEERLIYFDEMKDSLSQSVLIAQDTAERVKQAAQERSGNIVQQAEQDAQRLLDRAKYKANDILRQATDNAKRVAVETEELKNKTRVFHQRLKSTIESQLSIVDSQDWEDILRPTATYLQTSDEAFKVVVEEALGEKIELEEEVDVTRQFSPEEIAELQERIEQANRELAETQTLQTIDEELIQAQQKEILESVKRSESDEDSKVPVDLL
ncbi:DivIVA domain-containing protein [Streptococcus cristatus]|jgi:cell division protein divIVA, putative|uniref:Cell division protein DivIVA n=1 Tax=Streptococcus cristatus TaxID=45634 RepID=A0A3R9LQZ6_STRCR|nr:DivIVA domain-containing protein [Streptococcus cristatus]MBZ2151704.1 DivIVA domain-containing protein [Streptococcus cristatus]MCG7330053.1 DivIVA domain-containing protein [Streptococcus cristatus]RSJ72026.1 Cell division protein DivIVA [Streptococcus cristatus]RSJ76927.1 Cell division protein DivIVA [Streptococcus cristatus]RSJ84180.1 Cell division protein DivIVA [Streptococcus cristatus]